MAKPKHSEYLKSLNVKQPIKGLSSYKGPSLKPKKKKRGDKMSKFTEALTE